MSTSSEKLAAVRAKHRRPNPRRGAAAEEGDDDDRLAQFEKERAEWRAQNGVGPGGEGKLTVEQVQTYARKLETQNEETLERTIATAAEAEKVGAETLQKLDSQNQQLRKMDGDLKDMNVTMSRSERILHGMKSWGNSIMNSFTTPKKPLDTSYEGSGAAAKDAAKRVNESAATPKAKPSATTPTASAGAAATDAKSTTGKAGGDAKFGEFEPVRGRPHNPRTDEVLAETRSAKVDAQLDQLSNIVGTLHAQATAMGTSINESSDLIDHIDGVVDHTTHRVTRATRKAQRILDDN